MLTTALCGGHWYYPFLQNEETKSERNSVPRDPRSQLREQVREFSSDPRCHALEYYVKYVNFVCFAQLAVFSLIPSRWFYVAPGGPAYEALVLTLLPNLGSLTMSLARVTADIRTCVLSFSTCWEGVPPGHYKRRQPHGRGPTPLWAGWPRTSPPKEVGGSPPPRLPTCTKSSGHSFQWELWARTRASRTCPAAACLHHKQGALLPWEAFWRGMVLCWGTSLQSDWALSSLIPPIQVQGPLAGGSLSSAMTLACTVTGPHQRLLHREPRRWGACLFGLLSTLSAVSQCGPGQDFQFHL